ncbi:hypothetical protein HA402_003714 [Bradysia odoriphaga]|nr:hypothetical protein HA402_003714 [Bradysia odoriphaga]
MDLFMSTCRLDTGDTFTKISTITETIGDGIIGMASEVYLIVIIHRNRTPPNTIEMRTDSTSFIIASLYLKVDGIQEIRHIDLTVPSTVTYEESDRRHYIPTFN